MKKELIRTNLDFTVLYCPLLLFSETSADSFCTEHIVQLMFVTNSIFMGSKPKQNTMQVYSNMQTSISMVSKQ